MLGKSEEGAASLTEVVVPLTKFLAQRRKVMTFGFNVQSSSFSLLLREGSLKAEL